MQAEANLHDNLHIIGYSQFTRYMSQANYYLFFTSSPTAYKISRHSVIKTPLKIEGKKLN
jgi:hypothetical protein